ncbi:hypothetical protein Hanom_Chr04g00309661 [Helianthus anomalus]
MTKCVIKLSLRTLKGRPTDNPSTSVTDSNEQEEVVSSVQGKQNILFLDLNTPPIDETSPVDDSYHAYEPCYLAQ